MKTPKMLGFFLVFALAVIFQTRAYASAIQSISVQSVTYDGTTLWKDDGSGTYPTPHYSATNSSPVSYPCTSSLGCSITLSFTPSDATGYFSFNGLASDGTGFFTLVQQFKDPLMPTYTISTYYSSNFPANVHKISSVVWKYNLDGLSQPNTEAGTSTNPIYVTLQAPLGTTQKFHTVFEHACVPGGATTEGAAITNSWSKFDGPANTKNVAGENLYYYQSGVNYANNTNSLVADLLKNKNGRCGAWADLWMNVLRANGISATLKSVDMNTANYPNDQGFLALNWQQDNAGGSGHATYKWEITSSNAGQATYFEMVPIGNGDFGDLTSLTGIAGQNSSTPAEKVFPNHAIVLAGSSSKPYFDPSYGIRYVDAADVETKAVYGFFAFRSNPPNATKILVRMKAGGGIILN